VAGFGLWRIDTVALITNHAHLMSPYERTLPMNIKTPDALSTAIWKRLLLCSPIVVAAATIVTIRLAYLDASPTTNLDQIFEMAFLRIGLLLAFHTAPIAWGYLIFQRHQQKLITIPIYQVMLLLRMPLATWTAGCLVAAIIMWPMLGS